MSPLSTSDTAPCCNTVQPCCRLQSHMMRHSTPRRNTGDVLAQLSGAIINRLPTASAEEVSELRAALLRFAVTSAATDRARCRATGAGLWPWLCGLQLAIRAEWDALPCVRCARHAARCMHHVVCLMLDVGCWMLRAPAAQGGGDALPRAIAHRARLVLRDGARVVSECADCCNIQNAPHMQHTTWLMQHTCSIHRRSIKSTVPQCQRSLDSARLCAARASLGVSHAALT